MTGVTPHVRRRLYLRRARGRYLPGVKNPMIFPLVVPDVP